MKKKITIILTLVLMIGLLVGCTVSHGTLKNSIENDSSHRISATYDKFDGYKKTTLEVESDEEKTVNVDIETKKGELDLTITDEDGNAVYEEEDLETSTFDVTLDKEGKYTIRVDADNHSGSYDINW